MQAAVPGRAVEQTQLLKNLLGFGITAPEVQKASSKAKKMSPPSSPPRPPQPTPLVSADKLAEPILPVGKGRKSGGKGRKAAEASIEVTSSVLNEHISDAPSTIRERNDQKNEKHDKKASDFQPSGTAQHQASDTSYSVGADRAGVDQPPPPAVVNSPKDRWAWSSFQNSPEPDSLPIPGILAELMAAPAAPPPAAAAPNQPVTEEAPEAETQENVRSAVVSKLRTAVSTQDAQLLQEAISEAETAGLSHEAAMGRRKLNSM